MCWIDQDVAFHPCRDRRHQQQRRAPCREPRLAKGLADVFALAVPPRSEEHTSEPQSLMRISYAVFCLKKKTTQHTHTIELISTHNTANDRQSINQNS